MEDPATLANADAGSGGVLEIRTSVGGKVGVVGVTAGRIEDIAGMFPPRGGSNCVLIHESEQPAAESRQGGKSSRQKPGETETVQARAWCDWRLRALG